MADRTNDDGECKQVTVPFPDVSGSMGLAEGRDPEEWRAIMQRFFAILADAVAEFEGTVDKFTGGGIMAVFGAPVAHEDHARRACYAAIRMLDDVAEYAAELRRNPGPTSRPGSGSAPARWSPARSGPARPPTRRSATRSAWRSLVRARRRPRESGGRRGW